MIIDTQLDDGTPVCIRTVREDDEQRLRDGIARLTPHSRYLRFFSGMREQPQHIIDRLLDVDGYRHIAWGAIDLSDPKNRAIGIVHAFRDAEHPDTAEYSVAVIDEFHGKGLARILTAVLLLDCKRQGLTTLEVQILAENRPALHLARLLGGTRAGYADGITEFELDIDSALVALRDEKGKSGLHNIFNAFEAEG